MYASCGDLPVHTGMPTGGQRGALPAVSPLAFGEAAPDPVQRSGIPWCRDHTTGGSPLQRRATTERVLPARNATRRPAIGTAANRNRHCEIIDKYIFFMVIWI